MSCRPARKTTSSGSGLAGLQRLFDGLFQSAERDLAERGGGIQVGRDLLDQASPLGRELAKRIDAGIFDQPVGLDRDAADRLLDSRVRQLGRQAAPAIARTMAAANRSTAAGKTTELAMHGRMAESHDKPLREDRKQESSGSSWN